MKRYFRWLLPGLGLKRWIALAAVGLFLFGLGISLALRSKLYSRVEFWMLSHIEYSSNFFALAPWIIGALVVGGGVLLVLIGVSRLVGSVVHTLMPPQEGMAETYYQRRSLLRGPKVVALGGGTGLPTLLRGMKEYTSNITAVVTVADDGGSSGRLRSQFGILPPGDIRNCLVALADTEPLMEKLFQYRFDQGEGLAGHPFGNLFILAMTETTGNFYDAVQACSQVLAIRGQVMPSTLDQVVLKAQLATGEELVGESQIGKTHSAIRRVHLEQVAPGQGGSTQIQPLPQALEAIEQADVIVLGPGSLYTSIIPNLLVPGVVEAIRRSRALKVYICNVMTETGETDGYTVSQHLKALVDHAGYGVIDCCLVNSQPISDQLRKKYLEQGSVPVQVDVREAQKLGVEVVRAALLDVHKGYVRHSSEKLAREIGQLWLDRRSYRLRTPWDFFLLGERLQQRRWEEMH